MTEIGILVLFLFIVMIPTGVLYLAIDRETSEPTVGGRADRQGPWRPSGRPRGR